MRKLHQQREKTEAHSSKSSPEVVDVLKFGSWNVDGLDPGTGTHEALEYIILSEEHHESEDAN